MDDEKRVSESQFEELDASHASEYEPPSGYQVHWRTMAAIFSLAMGNVCAAVSNTVGFFPLLSFLPAARRHTSGSSS